MELSGWRAVDISKRLGVKKSRISNWLKGTAKCPREILDLLSVKIANEPQTKDELNGSKLAEGEKKSERSFTILDRVAEVGAREAFTLIVKKMKFAFAPIIAFARGGESAYPEDMEHASPRIAVPCKDPNCYVLELEGDSMEPLYSPGDLLVVAPNMEPINNDLVIVKTTEGEVFFKQYKHPRRAEEFQFLSLNPKYPPLYFRPDQLYRVSVVHSVIKPLKEKVRAMTVSESAVF